MIRVRFLFINYNIYIVFLHTRINDNCYIVKTIDLVPAFSTQNRRMTESFFYTLEVFLIVTFGPFVGDDMNGVLFFFHNIQKSATKFLEYIQR